MGRGVEELRHATGLQRDNIAPGDVERVALGRLAAHLNHDSSAHIQPQDEDGGGNQEEKDASHCHPNFLCVSIEYISSDRSSS